MDERAIHSQNLVIDQRTYTFATEVRGLALERLRPTIPAAKSGTLTTRTDDDTGTITMATGHGFSTSDLVSLFWNGGKRHNMAVTVTGDSVVFDGGTGDVLPIATTAITAMKPVEVAFTVDGDNVIALVGDGAAPGYIGIFDDEGPPELVHLLSVDNAKAHIWTTNLAETNPLAGHLTTLAKFSHGSLNPVSMTLAAISE
jgi:hypothetical protein